MSVSDMQRGRREHVAQRRRDAIARVTAYQRWLRAGSKLRSIPAIPSDGDYRIARAAGKAQ